MNIGENLAENTTLIQMEATVEEIINSNRKTIKKLKKEQTTEENTKK